MASDAQSSSKSDFFAYNQFAARELTAPRFARPVQVNGGVTKPVRSVAWSCDGKSIATGTEYQGLRIWDARSTIDKKASYPLPNSSSTPSPHNGHVASLAFSPTDPNILVSACKAASTGACVVVWDLTKPKAPIAKFSLRDTLSVAFHPSGRHFAAVNPTKYGDEVYFFHLVERDGKEVWEKREDIMGGAVEHSGSEEVNSLRFSNSGKFVCAVSNDGSLNAWEYPLQPRVIQDEPAVEVVEDVPMEEAEPEGTGRTSTPREATPVEESRDDVDMPEETAAEGEASGVAEGETRGVEQEGEGKEGEERADGEGENASADVAATTGTNGEDKPTEDTEAVANAEGAEPEEAKAETVLEDTSTPAADGEDVAMEEKVPSAPPTRPPTRPSTPPAIPNRDDIIARKKLEEERRIARRKAKQLVRLRSSICHSASLLALAFDPLGRYLAVGGQDALMSLLDTRNWICQRTFDVSSTAIRHVAFSPDGELIAVAGDETSIAIVSVFTGSVIATLPTGAPVCTLAWHPTKNSLAWATSGKSSMPTWSLVHQEI